ncbi:MAG: hypothetical protein KDB26_07125 [Microthrixaceae bacterium]|nr:hypothetical protein [Microthrixaceae bacterium]
MAVGTVLLVASLVIGLLGSVLTLGRLDQSGFKREVVIKGKRTIEIPGSLSFEVARPLSDDVELTMNVALVVTPTGSRRPECELKHLEGDAIRLLWLGSNAVYMSPNDSTLIPVAVARLAPGDYKMTCEAPDGSSIAGASEPKSFTVARVVGPNDLTGELSPLLWFAGVLVLTGIIFVAGGITLAVGLVRRGRKPTPPQDPVQPVA